MSTGQEIQKEAEIEVLKQLKPKEKKSQESSICEGTLVTRSRDQGNVTL
jgi:hypothetical protein